MKAYVSFVQRESDRNPRWLNVYSSLALAKSRVERYLNGFHIEGWGEINLRWVEHKSGSFLQYPDHIICCEATHDININKLNQWIKIEHQIYIAEIEVIEDEANL